MANQQQLIESLRAKQQTLGESDGAFAQRLGVDRETWRKVRTGEMLPGRRTLIGVRRAFPELIPEMLDFFLPDDARMLTTRARKNTETEPAETPA